MTNSIPYSVHTCLGLGLGLVLYGLVNISEEYSYIRMINKQMPAHCVYGLKCERHRAVTLRQHGFLG